MVHSPMDPAAVGQEIGDKLDTILDTLRHILGMQERILGIGAKLVTETDASDPSRKH